MSKPQLDFEAIATAFPPTSVYAIEHSWAAIAGSIVIGFGKEPQIAQLAHALLHATAHDADLQASAVRKLREGLLKASPLVGFPRSINGLSTLDAAVKSESPALHAQLAADKSLRASKPLAERQQRGAAFFRRVYAQHTDRVLASLNASSGGDLGEFAINCIYGDLVAEESILGARETGLLEMVCCIALGSAAQAKGHMYGAKNLGNSGAEIEAAIRIVRVIADQLDASWTEEGMEFLDTPKKKGW